MRNLARHNLTYEELKHVKVVCHFLRTHCHNLTYEELKRAYAKQTLEIELKS